MKRGVVLLAALAALGLASCDMMFETNLFKDITHEDLTAGQLASASPAEIEDYLASDEYKEQISEDPALQQAIVDSLGTTITTEEAADPTGVTASPALQEAAIAQAAVLIQTSAAAQVSTGLLAALPDLLSESETGMNEATVVDAFLNALPPDIEDALSSGSPTPPSSFVAMIAAFDQAAAAYLALGADLDDGGAAAYAIPITGEKALDIAINAAISVFVDSVQPVSGTVAEALWSALIDPMNAGTYITIDPAMQGYFDSAYDPDSNPGTIDYDPSIMNLLEAAGITIN